MELDLPTVLRIPRIDDQTEYVLLKVSSAGKSPLDLKLIGTDAESVFSVALNHRKASSLRNKTYSGSQEELNHLLSIVLLGAEKDETSQGIEAVARVESEKSLTISVQRSIEGITQKYADIKLLVTEEEESFIDWCSFTVQARDKAISKVGELEKKLKEKELETKELSAELAALVRNKNENENSLIEKFSLLLNEKKMKIRDQQRLLASATVDPAKLAAVERSRDARARSPGPSRSGKRKAVRNDESDTDSDGFEKMDVDAPEQPDESEEDQVRTPDAESTTDEASDDEGSPPPLLAKPAHPKSSGSQVSSSTLQAEIDVPPPKRDLPFAKKKAVPPPKPAAAAEGSETESDDDEL